VSRLTRHIERRIDTYIEMRKRHLVAFEKVLEMVRGNNTPETFVIESDGVPLASPQPFSFMSRNVVWIEELLASIPIDLEAMERVRMAVRDERFADAVEAAEICERLMTPDMRRFGEISPVFTASDDAPLAEKDFRSARHSLIEVIETLCLVGAGQREGYFFGSRHVSAEWVWVKEPYQRRNPFGYTVSFGPDTRFLVVGGEKPDKLKLVDNDSQYLKVTESDVLRREAIDTGPSVPFLVVEILEDHRRREQYEEHNLERSLVTQYIKAAPVVLSARFQTADRFDESQPRITVAYRTDGEWIWSHESATYVDRYDMALPAAFLNHIAQNQGRVPEVDDERRSDAVEVIERWSTEATNT